MSSLWKGLPPEILDLVLACLPVHVLCRFRLVCKRWNHLITQPGFASLHAQAPRQPSCVLLTARHVEFRAPRQWNWEMLDMVEKRFYTLRDSFIDHYLHNRFSSDFGNLPAVPGHKYTLAADGGLIYAIYYPHHNGTLNGRPRKHIVCNPVSKTFHHIMEPEFHFSFDHRDTVVMSVDNTTLTYRIIIMESYASRWSPRQEDVYLCDSTTLHWRKLCKIPGEDYFVYSSIFLSDVFYILFMDSASVPWIPKLYSCDLQTGAWSFIGVELPQPSHPQDKSLLVVTLGRLFFVEYTGLPRCLSSSNPTIWEDLHYGKAIKKKHLIRVAIWEVLLAEKEVVKVTQMPKFSKYPQHMLHKHRFPRVRGNPVVAVGCGDWIVVSSLLGRCVGFELSKKRWHELLANSGKHGDCGEGIYGSLVHLDFRT